MATQIYALNVNYNAGGQFCTNIHHYSFDDGGFPTTASAALALITAWIAADFTALRNILSTHVTIISAKANRITNGGGFEATDQFSSSNTGNRTGNLQAAGIGPVMIWYPQANGKARGRTFVPGISETDCLDGIMTSAYKTVLATWASTMLAGFSLVGGTNPPATFGLWSRKTASFTPFAEASQSDMIGQVRRRQLPV
jgi:hypothetical protein